MATKASPGIAKAFYLSLLKLIETLIGSVETSSTYYSLKTTLIRLFSSVMSAYIFSIIA